MRADRNPHLLPSDGRHGTTNGYCNLGCRCDPCRVAWAAYGVQRRLRRESELAGGAPTPRSGLSDVVHGSESTYFNWRCRCAGCTEAHRIGQAARRKARQAAPS